MTALNAYRLSRFGNTYRLVVSGRSRLFPDDGEVIQPRRNPHRECTSTIRSDDSCRRAASAIRKIALCNEWQFFVTFTFSPKRVDRYNLDDVYRLVAVWLNHQRDLSPNLKYICVPEQHKDGAWHVHALIANFEGKLRKLTLGDKLPARLRRRIKSGGETYVFPSWDKHVGWCTVEPVRDSNRSATYIAKYLVKGSLPAGIRAYRVSRSCSRPEIVHEEYFTPEVYENVVEWAAIHEIPTVFTNDYCVIFDYHTFEEFLAAYRDMPLPV